MIEELTLKTSWGFQYIQNMNFKCWHSLLKVMDQRVQWWLREQRKMVRFKKQLFYLARLAYLVMYILFTWGRGEWKGNSFEVQTSRRNKYVKIIFKWCTIIAQLKNHISTFIALYISSDPVLKVYTTKQGSFLIYYVISSNGSKVIM